jgi:hypothetical protein
VFTLAVRAWASFRFNVRLGKKRNSMQGTQSETTGPALSLRLSTHEELGYLTTWPPVPAQFLRNGHRELTY